MVKIRDFGSVSEVKHLFLGEECGTFAVYRLTESPQIFIAIKAPDETVIFPVGVKACHIYGCYKLVSQCNNHPKYVSDFENDK